MSETPNPTPPPPRTEREKLARLLESYGGTLAGFEALRSDSYEHCLARQSLERLEHLYCELFRAGQTAEQSVKTVPPWPPGTKWEGEQPSVRALEKIQERFRTEEALNSLTPISRFMEATRQKAGQLPIGQQQEVLNAVMTLVGQELLSAKLKGSSVTANLEAVSALQYQERTRLKEREIANRENALALLVKKYEDERAQQKGVMADDKLTPEQKLEQQKRILGMI